MSAYSSVHAETMSCSKGVWGRERIPQGRSHQVLICFRYVRSYNCDMCLVMDAWATLPSFS